MAIICGSIRVAQHVPGFVDIESHVAMVRSEDEISRIPWLAGYVPLRVERHNANGYPHLGGTGYVLDRDGRVVAHLDGLV